MKMKKVNPKVVAAVTILLTLLIGGIAVEKVIGEPTSVQGAMDDDTGIF
ncbi:MAG: hypothetical protein HZR80_20090 [Candidatus Heimdallarchaeota archaeon]